MYDIIIIGAGPAGLTAAIYALRANKKVLVLESKSYGGQIINANLIENYPGLIKISGYDFATNLYNQVASLGGNIIYEEVIKIDKDKKVITNKNEYQSNAIIIATGSGNRKLNIDNEDKYLSKGISYCATCDGNFYKNKVVAVVGGGSVALEDALYLADIAKLVYVIHRRDSFRGDATYLEELKKKDNVKFIMNSNITKLIGDDLLKGIEINNEEILDIDGLFIAIGRIPQNELVSDILDLDEEGYIKSLDGVHTNIKGIYVAGDVRSKDIRQLTTAVADGTVAATTAIRELNL